MTDLNEKLRAEFETWAELTATQAHGVDHDVTGWYYFDELTSDRWEAWQAARASALAPQAAPSTEKLRQAYLNGLLMAAQVCDAKLKERAATGHAREASTARTLAEEIRGFAADAPVPFTQAAPTDVHMYEDRPADDLARAGEAFERDVYAILKGASPKRIDEPADVIAARASTCTDISSMSCVSAGMTREQAIDVVRAAFSKKGSSRTGHSGSDGR